MKLTKKHLLNLSTKDQNLLLSTMKEASRLWNDLIDLCYNAYLNNEKWLTGVDMQKLTQSKYNLHSDIITSICQRMDSNRRTTLELRKQKPGAKFPYIKKDEITISGKKRQFLKDNYISLTKLIKIKIPEEIDIYSSNIFHIVHRKSNFYLYLSYEQEEKPIVKTGIQCAVDLGEIHTIAAINTQGVKTIFTGRLARSFKRFRNKTHSQLATKMKRCQENSRRYKKLQNIKNRTSKKTKNKLNDFYHHLTDKFIKECLIQKVDTIFIGNCKNVGQRTKQEHRLHRKNRQKMSQFEVGTIRNLISYKSQLSGIDMQSVSERWTTQTCPACGNHYKPTGRNYKCPKCQFIGHRDIVGCYNILEDNVPGVELSLIDGKIKGIHPIKVSTKVSTHLRSRRLRLSPCQVSNLTSYLRNQESQQFIAGE